jgi:hypothetical protein
MDFGELMNMTAFDKAWLVTKFKEPTHIVWASPEKIIGWVNGNGPYSASYLNHLLTTYPNEYQEHISGE